MALVLIFPDDFSGEYREQPDRYESDHRRRKSSIETRLWSEG